MTPESLLTLVLLLAAAVLFITEWLRADLVALLVLVVAAATGLVTPVEAISGFSNPAVITVWAMFIISGALTNTGVAGAIGSRVLRVAGQGQMRLLLVIMLTAAVLSAFMNNVGVAALMLPVVMAIARQTGTPPSRLLMPLAYACLLGGLTTLIGTPPNILVSDALREAGYEPFRLFDFAPVGVPLVLAGVAFIALVGRFILPHKDVRAETAVPRPQLDKTYNLQERLFMARIPANSPLAGQTLAASRLGRALGVTVIGIWRNHGTQLAPNPATVLRAGDRLLLIGRRSRVEALPQRLEITPAAESAPLTGIETAVLRLHADSPLVGKTLSETDFRQRSGVNVLAIRRNGTLRSQELAQVPLQSDDHLVVQGSQQRIFALAAQPEFTLSTSEAAEFYSLPERLLLVRVPADSALVGKTLAKSQLGAAMGLTVLGRMHGEQIEPLDSDQDYLEAGDMLLVQGTREDAAVLAQLATLEVDQSAPDTAALESEQIGLVEATLSPQSTAADQTLAQLHFREKYSLTVVALWRGGRAYRHGLNDMPLRLGDGLLLYGPRSAWPVLASDPDYIVLEKSVQAVPRASKAPLALLLLGVVLLPVMFNWLPIAITAVMGAALMVATGCLSMDEAYRYIEWKAVFLIAGMLPLGIAMQNSGAAEFLAQGMIAAAGPWGITAVLAGLFLLTNLASQVMPSSVVVVVLAPIALKTAVDLQVSPQTLLMTVAVAAISLLSPVGHPANILVMGPGGYRPIDYVRFGLPLMVLLFLLSIVLLPLIWPL